MCKCPVCGRTGIPDYHNENVVCPNCNSDLGVYRTLNAIAEDNNSSGDKARKFKLLSIVLPLLAALLIGILSFVYFNGETKKLRSDLAKADNLTIELRDSLSRLNEKMDSSPSTALSSHYIEYEIISNDSPGGIVHKFYGTQKKWEDISRKIAEANNIWDDKALTWKPIHPGQIIKIYNFK